MVPDCAKTSAAVTTLKKLTLDQFMFAPLITLGFFFNLNFLEGNSANKAVEDIKQKYAETMIINWKLWLPANFLNFYFISAKSLA